MKFGSVCSGIEAASVAFEPLGWKAAWFSEIDPFPCAVLKHHYPDTPNHGDMTTLPEKIKSGEVEAPDLFCGGTPCQAFSVAGLRQSLSDDRGNLSLTFCEIANAIDHVRSARGEQPCIVFWENVPGVLSTQDNAFGCFLGALSGCDSPILPGRLGWTDAGVVAGPQRTVAWRVLDAQYFGLAQRRRRVFVVASARDGFNPAEVLLEFDGVRRDSAPSREAGKGFAASTTAGSTASSEGVKRKGESRGQDSVVAMCLNAHPGGRFDAESETLLPTAFGFDGDVMKDGLMETMTTREGAISDTAHAVMQPIAIQDVRGVEKAQNGKGWNDDGTAYTVDTHATQGICQPIAWDEELNASVDQAGTLLRGGQGGRHDGVAVAFVQNQRNEVRLMEVAGALAAEPGAKQQTYLQNAMQVRRLTPMECERLQGFPDGYTAIPWRGKPTEECPDGPRYKALGNSWAVPCVQWIGRRIQQGAQGKVPS